MITDQKFSVAETSGLLGGCETRLRACRAAVLERGDATFPGHGNPSPGDDELRQLRAENVRLRAERDLVKSRRVLRQTAELTFRFVAEHAEEWPVAWVCEALEVSTTGYFAWSWREDTPTHTRRQEPLEAIEEVHAEMRQRYVSPPVPAELKVRVRLLGEHRGQVDKSPQNPGPNTQPVESFFGRMKCEIAGSDAVPRNGLRWWSRSVVSDRHFRRVAMWRSGDLTTATDSWDAYEMFPSKAQAKAEIVEYLEVFSNHVRRHSSLGFVSPEEFERTWNLKHRELR